MWEGRFDQWFLGVLGLFVIYKHCPHTMLSLPSSGPISFTNSSPSLSVSVSLRTIITVTELLAAVCLVRGGHSKVMEAVENFKMENNERHRFECLVQYFMDHRNVSTDFQIACMNFINVVVHSTEDLNLRVHLQHEFSLLGLEDYMQ